MGEQCAGSLTQRENILYLDVLRGTAIYLVIALHCGADFYTRLSLFGTATWWMCNICSSFVRMGVPVFFMISGFLLLSDPKTLDIKSFYKRRIGKLVVPFLVWDVVYFLEQCVVNGRPARLGTFVRELALQGSRYHLWFLYQIAAIYLLLPFLKKIIDHSTRRELLVLLGVILLQPTLLRFFNVVQPLVYAAPFLALMEGYTGFFVTGYLLGTCQVTRKLRLAVYAVGAAGLVMGIAGNYLLSSPEQLRMVFAEGYSITQYMTSGAFFLLVRELAPRLPGWASRAAQKLSRLSFGVYLSHVLVLDLFLAVLRRLELEPAPVAQMVGSFLAVAVFSTAGVYLGSKIPVVRRIFL